MIGYLVLSFLKTFFRRYYYSGCPKLKICKSYYRNTDSEYYYIIIKIHGFSYIKYKYENFPRYFSSYEITRKKGAEEIVEDFYTQWNYDIKIMNMDRRPSIIKEYVYETRLSKDDIINNLEKQVELLSRSDTFQN